MSWKSYRVSYRELGPYEEVLVTARNLYEACEKVERKCGPIEIEDITELPPKKPTRSQKQ